MCLKYIFSFAIYFRTSIFKGPKHVYLLIFLISYFVEVSHKAYNDLHISKLNRHNDEVGFPISATDNTYWLKMSCICMIL